VKYAFIQVHQAEFPISLMCRVLKIARSGYYKWLSQPPSERERVNAALTEAIKAAHTASRQTYGAPRIYRELKALGRACGRHRVARLMRRAGMVVRPRRRYKATTNSNHDHPVAPNVLNREFTATRPNEKWLTDITYVPTRQGWLYLAVVLDVYSRLIVGWALDKTLDQSLVLRALRMALVHRCPPSGLLHHSDRGSQYAAHAYQQVLKAHGVTVSMSGTGNCYDNAMMESFFATLKAECVTDTYATRAEAKHAIVDYIAVWYNRQRRHSSLDYVSPIAFEAAYHQGLSLSTKAG
jgi:transposase InsO family protein